MTAAQKLRVGDPVLVSLKGGRGDMTAQKGRVTELAGRGAFVELASGKKNFFFASDITKDEDQVRPVRIVPPKHHESRPPEPIVPRPTIGQLVHAERESRGISQEALARAVGRDQAYVINLERGLVGKADDELLLKLSEVFFLDLEELEQANERTPVAPPKPLPLVVEPLPAKPASNDASATVASVSAPVPPLEVQAAPVAPALPSPSSAPIETSDQPPAATTYDAFIEQLSLLCDLPRDREKRKRWLSLARELYGLVGA